MVFPIFFNLSLNMAIRSSGSELQSALGLVFADCMELLHLGCKEYNQSQFHLDFSKIKYNYYFHPKSLAYCSLLMDILTTVSGSCIKNQGLYLAPGGLL